MKRFAVIFAVPAVLATAPAHAYFAFGTSGSAQSLILTDTTSIASSNTGWFRNDGSHVAGNTNYVVGDFGRGILFHDFFVFDAGGPAARVSLQLQPGVFDFNGLPGGFTLTLYDLASVIDTQQSYANTGIYNDLGSGTVFGTASFTSQPAGPVNIVLNSSGIAAYNAAGRAGTPFSIGGALSAGVVPEPASWALVIGGFAMTGFAARRGRSDSACGANVARL